MPEWLNTLLSLIAGSGLAMLSGWVGDRRAASRDREARADERRDRVKSKRDDFQRDTLLQLQDAAMRLARCTGAANHQDVTAYRKTGEWQKQQLSEPLNENFRVATAEVTLLATRIRDSETRGIVNEFQIRCTGAALSPNEAAAEREMLAMGKALEQLHQRSGRLIRELDDIE